MSNMTQSNLLLADVELINSKYRLLTDSIVTVEEVFGQDPQATNWFYINTQYDVGPMVAGDTVQVNIAAGPNATLFPSVSVTTTVTAGIVAASNPEIALANQIVSDLNANSVFKVLWKAQRIKDFSAVFISSKIYNEWGERKNPGDFSVITTGTITVSIAFDSITRRGFSTELSRSPNDPRKGILAISGSVAVTPGEVADIFIQNALNSGSPNMLVNGSVTPVPFTITPLSTQDIFVNELRLYGNANGIKFGQFLGQNAILTNGLLLEIKSEDKTTSFPVLKSTDDIKHKFARGAVNFDLDVQAGRDDFMASFTFENPFPIRHQGLFTTDDYIKITVRDNLTTNLQALEFIAFGFKKDI